MRGALEDMSDYVKREGWSDKEFFSAPWRDGQYDGHTFVVPFEYILEKRNMHCNIDVLGNRPCKIIAVRA
jgi:maltose-binding protein MalE